MSDAFASSRIPRTNDDAFNVSDRPKTVNGDQFLTIGKNQNCRHAPSSLVAMKSLASGKHMNFAPAPAALRMTLRQTVRFLATLFFEQICATAAKVAGMAKLVGVSGFT